MRVSCSAALLTCVTLLALACGLTLARHCSSRDPHASGTVKTVKSGETLEDSRKYLGKAASSSVLGNFGSAAVSTDAPPCARVAADVLRINGSAADAAVAGLLCVGVVNPQSMGLGGGFLLTYYHRASGTAHTLDAREKAPAAASEQTYSGKKELMETGGLAVGVPGEVRGYRALYQRFGGKVAWSRLVEPALRMCEDGQEVSWHMAKTLRKYHHEILKEPSMWVFQGSSGGRLREGERLRRPQLAATLRALTEDPDALYTGSLARRLLQDIRAFGGIIDAQDLRNYRPVWRKPVRVKLSMANLTMYSVPPPGAGLILGLILNVLDQYNITPHSQLSLTHHRLVEAMKWAYGQRVRLADPAHVNMAQVTRTLSSDDFAAHILQRIDAHMSASRAGRYFGAERIRQHQGTSHFSVLAPNGDAVSATSSINTPFGAGIRSRQTGIVLNSAMGDFTHPSDQVLPGVTALHNTVQPGKRPRSSMSPAVIVDDGGQVRLVVGASGGHKIPAAVAQVAARALWLNYTIKEAIDDPRLYLDQDLTTENYEQGLSREILAALKRRKHILKRVKKCDMSVVNAVLQDRPLHVSANADHRKRGAVDGY